MCTPCTCTKTERILIRRSWFCILWVVWNNSYSSMMQFAKLLQYQKRRETSCVIHTKLFEQVHIISWEHQFDFHILSKRNIKQIFNNVLLLVNPIFYLWYSWIIQYYVTLAPSRNDELHFTNYILYISSLSSFHDEPQVTTYHLFTL